MRNFKLICGIVLLILTCFQSYSQEYTLEEKTVTGVFSAEGKKKSEIFSSINKWISLNYNSAQSVIHLNDNAAGNIIVKGISEMEYKNAVKEYFPNNKSMEDFTTKRFKHTMEINVKDNKYRILYTLTEIVYEQSEIYYMDEYNDLIFDLIDFTGLKQEPENNYNIFIDQLWKKNLMGKKKREKIPEITKSLYQEMDNGILAYIKKIMESIDGTIKSTKNNDW